MIELVICIRCDACGIAMEHRHAPGIGAVPGQAAMNIGAMPAGWTLQPTGEVTCPAHEIRRVEPIVAMPNLQAIRGGLKS